ncbi:MAG: DNA-binding protein, partial [Clostridia bacterium]|nr:DNA-binding protein [Clostridia bacterium]
MSTLGFDTSNYTTSVAFTDGRTDKSVRQILSVKEGERGIRQSDGVFQHMKLLPELFEKLNADMKDVTAIGVSTRPRTVEGSYMPVFLAGHGYARVAAKTLGVPLYEFSHQDGHIMAGIYSCGAFELLTKPFLSVHLSGGTTEMLRSE